MFGIIDNMSVLSIIFCQSSRFLLSRKRHLLKIIIMGIVFFIDSPFGKTRPLPLSKSFKEFTWSMGIRQLPFVLRTFFLLLVHHV